MILFSDCHSVFDQSHHRRERSLERGHRRVAAEVRGLHRQQHEAKVRRRRTQGQRSFKVNAKVTYS